MAQRPRRLKLQYSIHIKPRLAEIWRWNADQYGESHATEFVNFLHSQTKRLELFYALGRPVPKRPSYRYMILKKRSAGHGYVVVYEILKSEVHILFYFHTAQDWVGELEKVLPQE